MGKKIEKTNMEYLREFIEGNDEAIEFWDAVNEELSAKEVEIEDLKVDIKDLESKVSELNSQVTDLLEEDIPELETLDFGFGEIEFVYPDNLKLQGIMDELKSNPEKLLQFE